MRKLQWLLCGLVMTIGACAEPADVAPTAPTLQDETGQPVQIISRSQGLPVRATETCTITEGVCKAGRCELPNDTFQSITEVCCTNGVCTTEHYRLCGC